MTLTTTFVNKTTVDIKLKEGNAGVYRELGILKGLPTADAEPGGENRLTQEFDEKSTYKEFRVATVSGQRGSKFTKLITSDFILDNGVIYIAPNPQRPEGFQILGDSRSSVRPESFSPFAVITNILNRLRRSRTDH